MNISSEQKKMVIALLLVAVLSALILAITDRFTREPIAEAIRQTTMKALMKVLPEHANDPLTDRVTEDGTNYYVARNADGKVLAFAWQQVAPDGYNGSIYILIGVDNTGKTVGIRITKHKETPGLGDAITKDMTWLASFSGHTLDTQHWAVKKDGGDIDQFTGATITPRAVVAAVYKGLQKFVKNKQEILAKARFLQTLETQKKQP
ncbi:MAG: RnfABCDGE type electron transport complex subunit G [Mariprofundaceae bacterium]|nr:RnfABCDGE type electron transport complex subunit G [Mariprofundaceae bacterium]